jgi:hypothetical protein
MTEQRQQPDSDGTAPNDEPANTDSSNGTHPDAAVAVAEFTAQEAVEPAGPASPLDASADVADSTPDPAIETAAEAAPDAAPADDGTAFMADLARAMQQTADVERKRIDEDIERRRAAHLETIRARRESGEASIRELADADLKAIDDWAQDEHQRINLERKQKATALQEDLDASLAEHGSRIDTEMEGVEAAIAGYRTDVDGYFATMKATTDPVEIAQHAARRPIFPDLAAVSSAQSELAGQTAAQEAPVPVMDAEAAADPATAWARWNETGSLPEITETPTAPVAPSADPAASGSLLQSIPASRPYGAYNESTQDH